MTQLLPPQPNPSGERQARLRLPDLDWKLGYVLALPFLLWLLAAPSYFYDPPGFLDSFVYVGYFQHYHRHLPLFDTYYKVSRLPWILPGFVSFQLFGPMTGTVVLQLATLLLGVVSTYLAVRDSLDGRTALATAALLGVCPWFNGCGGWNYHMGITVGYYLLTVMCLNRAALGGRPNRWYLFAGAALSLAVQTHLFLVVLIPGLVIHYVSSCLAGSRRLSWRHVAAALGGVAGSTALLAAIHRATGGQWLYFMPQIDYTLWLARGGNAWHSDGYLWLLATAFLALPAVVLLASPLTWLVVKPWTDPATRGRTLILASYQVQTLLAVLAGVYFQFVKRQSILDHDYMAAYLIGPAFLGLSTLVYSLGRGWTGLNPHLVGLAVLAIALAPLLPVVYQVREGFLPFLWSRFPLLSGNHLLVPLALPLAGIAYWVLRRNTAHAAFVGLAALSFAGSLYASPYFGSSRDDRSSRDAFAFMMAAERFTARLDPTLRDVRYWFDYKESVATPAGPYMTTPIFDSYVSTRGWLGNLFGGHPVPDVGQIETKHLGRFRRLAVLCAEEHREDYARRLRARFAELGLDLHPQGRKRFQHGPYDLAMAVFWIVPKPKPSPPADPTPDPRAADLED